MNRIKIFTMICGALILGSACTNMENSEINKKALFYMEDVKNDDNGGGTYTYPTDKKYMEGSFDITEFTLYETEDYYEFYIKINSDFTNYEGNFEKWDTQMFDIYLKFDEGKHNMAVSGRNVKFTEKWDKAIVIAPIRTHDLRRVIYDKNGEVSDYVSNYEDLSRDILVPDTYVVDYNAITAKISKNKIGDLGNLIGIQVFSLGFDKDAKKKNTFNMLVENYTGQNNFGGGTNFDGNPNVIDILGSNEKLADYISEEGYEIYPTIDFIKVK